MTISSATNKVSYSGNGSTTVFAYAFPITADADLAVYIRSAAGTETLKTLTTHYTVSGAGTASGGNVTFGAAPASGETVVILRNIPATQSLDLVENDSFSAESLEDSIDRVTMISSDVKEELSRAIKLSRTNTMTSTEFTNNAADRASKVLSFDSSGELSVAQELGTFTGNWAASTAYALRDLIKDTSNNNIYICITAHTSTGSQPISGNTDVAKWSLIVDAAAAATSAAASATSATASAASATTATAQAGISTAQAVISTTKAGEAATSATASAASSTTSSQYALKVDGAVTGSDFSAKSWALGGTDVTTTASRGAAKEWAISTGAAVDTSEYSAKEYAIGTTVAVGSAKDWAVQAEDSAVTGSSYSALHHAAKAAASATASASSATASAASATAAAASAAGLDHTLDDAVGLIIALG